MTGVWSATPPFSETKDRWLRLTWAAKHFKIDRTALLSWAKDGTIVARQKPYSGEWLVSEQSLRKHLFGSMNAGT